MQIVKLADAGEARLQHLDIGLRRDGLHLVGRHRQREAIHRLAPAPKAVLARPAPLGEARHRALKRVAVDIGEAGRGEGVALVLRLRRGAGFERGDGALRQRHAHVAAPAFRHQRPTEIQRVRHRGARSLAK